MVEVKTLINWDTEYSADSVEWCPADGLQHLLICGTYQLTPDEEQLSTPLRQGLLHLLSFNETKQILERLQSVEMPAVLDCKWSPQQVQDHRVLAVANAVGQLCLYNLSQGETPQLQEESRIDLPRKEDDPELLALSLDWCKDGRLAVSDSRGRISIVRLTETGMALEHNWKAHEFEAWTVHFDTFNPDICYTGGDDSKLRVYDLRMSLDSAKMTSSAHSAGVTSFSCSTTEPHSLLSGSYDEQILLWDTRQMRAPVCCATAGGGVWRIKRGPTLILAACMYGGHCLLTPDLAGGPRCHYTEHESIAYGADWCQLPGEALVATCSFYDHKLCIGSVTQNTECNT